jgi:hypothetical protein
VQKDRKALARRFRRLIMSRLGCRLSGGLAVGRARQQARPSEEFDKEPTDVAPILNASFEVETVFDPDDGVMS